MYNTVISSLLSIKRLIIASLRKKKLAHLFSCPNPADPAVQPSSPVLSSETYPSTSIPTRVIKAAAKKLRQSTAKSEGPVEIVPIPDGAPMFMYQPLKGKNNPVNAFYDSGCSNACIRTGTLELK